MPRTNIVEAGYGHIRGVISRMDDDPLRYWRFAVPRLREAIALFAQPKPIDELHLRACNLGTKTTTAAAFVVACAQKRETLDGVTLPQWYGPVEAAQLVLDYKQQVLSVQPAYLRALGRWPHKIRWQGEIISSISIMPVDGSEKWSIVHFLSQENKRSGIGVRADIVAFDEPPVIEILRELRKAGHAGRRGIRLIAETPTLKRQWRPLQADYGDCPRRTLRRVDQERAECRWSLDEVADWVISKERKAQLDRIYQNDPLAKGMNDARRHGDYCDTTGLCPFDVPTLQAMLEQCVEPEMLHWQIRLEKQGSQTMQEARVVPIEVYAKPKKDARYWITVDPSSGVDDDGHDPYEVEVAEMGSGILVARAGGYVAGNLVGVLSAGLARQYNDAIVDVEVNDRWGTNVIDGIHAAGYTNLAREPRELRPGEWVPEIGFHNTQASRPKIIGAVQAWIEAWRAGAPYAECKSRFVINTLLDCIMDEAGKIVAAPGFHDEALICWGESLRRTVRNAGRQQPMIATERKSPERKLVEMIQGKNGTENGHARIPGGRKRP